MAKIKNIMAAANGGLALIGGWYVYLTLPYVYVTPILSGGERSPILSYGGPGECNYDNEEKTCVSDKTIEDTMGDQGRPCMWYSLSHHSRITVSRGRSKRCLPRDAFMRLGRAALGGSSVALIVPRWALAQEASL